MLEYVAILLAIHFLIATTEPKLLLPSRLIVVIDVAHVER